MPRTDGKVAREKWAAEMLSPAADERILTGPKNSDRVTGPKNMDREKWLAEKWLRRHHHTPYTYFWLQKC